MLAELRLEDTTIQVVELMSKDSLDMTEQDRSRILAAVRDAETASGTKGIVILHGTDTLARTGELLAAELKPRIPIVLTGAMRPFEMKQSDALQDLKEAIFANGLFRAGVYWVAYGRALAFRSIRKARSPGLRCLAWWSPRPRRCSATLRQRPPPVLEPDASTTEGADRRAELQGRSRAGRPFMSAEHRHCAGGLEGALQSRRSKSREIEDPTLAGLAMTFFPGALHGIPGRVASR
jgi:L-asparaginase